MAKENTALVRKAIFVLLTLTIVMLAKEDVLGQVRFGKNLLKKDDDWFRSEQAREIADSVIQYQSPQGGWPKNTELSDPPRKITALPDFKQSAPASAVTFGRLS